MRAKRGQLSIASLREQYQRGDITPLDVIEQIVSQAPDDLIRWMASLRGAVLFRVTLW